MTRFRFVDVDEKETDMLDGILQPGGHYRVPMFLRDNVTINPSLTPVQRAIATTRQHDAATFDAATFDAASHKPGPRYGTNDAAANDAAAKRDAAYEEYQRYITDAWKSKAPPAGSYPANGANEGDACTINGASGTLRAIAGNDGWLQCRPTNRTDAQPTNDARDAAYQDYESRLQNAWRNAS